MKTNQRILNGDTYYCSYEELTTISTESRYSDVKVVGDEFLYYHRFKFNQEFRVVPQKLPSAEK